MTIIRPMTPADAKAVSELVSASWRNTYSPLMGAEKTEAAIAGRFTPQKLAAEAGDDNVISLVAQEYNSVLSGYAMALMDDDRQAWLERLHIVPEKWGAGVAENLLRAMLAKHSGLSSIALEVIKGNDRAKAFYEKHGFVTVEEKAACGSIEGVPTLVMKKLLPNA